MTPEIQRLRLLDRAAAIIGGVLVLVGIVLLVGCTPEDAESAGSWVILGFSIVAFATSIIASAYVLRKMHAGRKVAASSVLLSIGLVGCTTTTQAPPVVALANAEITVAGGATLAADYTAEACARVDVLVYGMPVSVHFCEVLLDNQHPCTIATMEGGGFTAGGALPIGPEVCRQRFGSFRAAPFGAADVGSSGGLD